nr:TenA family protein [Saccharolobus caldissimus]
MVIMDSIQYLLKGAENLWNNYVRHEFVIKMKEGTLPLDVFRYYLIQDAKYVEDMLKAVLLASSKGPIDIVTKILQAIFYSRDKGLETNKKLYSKLGITIDEIRKTGYNLVNYAYTRHLYYYANIGWNEFLVAWAPCMLGYSIIGDFVVETSHEIYKLWATFYSSQEYKRRVDAIVEALNNVNINENILNIFITSIRFEIGFWDSALRKEPTVY